MPTELKLSPPPRPKVRIPAFGVFAGGGAKTAVFPGCLAAAEERNIEFQGYGGSSGGAIIAALAAAGYTAEEIHEILLETKLNEAFLDDKGLNLASLAPLIGRLSEQLQATTLGGWRNIFRRTSAMVKALRTLKRYMISFPRRRGCIPLRRFAILLRDAFVKRNTSWIALKR